MKIVMAMSMVVQRKGTRRQKDTEILNKTMASEIVQITNMIDTEDLKTKEYILVLLKEVL